MKWPTQVVLIRHAPSEYNILKDLKAKDPMYTAFKKAYNKDHRSEESNRLAREVREKYALKASDAKTPITAEGRLIAQTMGENLSKRTDVNFPHVIYVSPYLRTRETLACMTLGWPALENVKTVPEDRVREQEHGLSTLFNDWRVFHVFYPDQKDFQDERGPYWYAYPQGESRAEVRDRARSFLGTLIREYSGHTVFVITHHLTILSMRANQERWGEEEFVEMDEHHKPINCGVTIYNGVPNAGKDGRLILGEYNLKLY